MRRSVWLVCAGTLLAACATSSPPSPSAEQRLHAPMEVDDRMMAGDPASVTFPPGVVTFGPPTSSIVYEPPPGVVELPHGKAQARLVVDQQQAPHRPRLPPALDREGMQIWGDFRVFVARDGAVSRVSVIKRADPLVDDLWIQAIRTWRFKPHVVDGKAVSFCYATRVHYLAK